METEASENNDIAIAVGRLVEVQSRTWPGINKPGGVARVTCVSREEEGEKITHVDVRYILGSSKEKQVPVEYVALAPQYEIYNQTKGGERSTLRDRSMLLGRCRRCGSLRTDCGSCDWATEEQQQEKMAIQRRSRQARKKNDDHYDDSSSSEVGSSSSSSSSEEDVLLEELLKQNQRKYRRYLRNKMAFSKTFKLSQRKEKKKSTVQESSYSSPEEDANTNNRYRDYLRNKARWKRQQRVNKPKRRHHASVLESLTTLSTTSSDDGTPPRPSKKEHQQTQNKTSDDCGSPVSRKHSDGQSFPANSSLMVGAAVYSSSEDDDDAVFSEPRYDGDSSTNEEDLLHALPLHSLESSLREDDKDDNMIALSQFIQPEGQEVAEKLPQDVVDQTSGLDYQELPRFFDTTAEKLEELITDYKLAIARLTRCQRQLGLSFVRRKAIIDPSQLLVQCQEMFSNVRTELIRNGTDQCRVALYKLMDDRMYRKNRRSLSVKQRRLCRASGITEARNLRLDALEDRVEDLVQTLKQVAQKCQEHIADQEEDDEQLNVMATQDNHEDYTKPFEPIDQESPDKQDPPSPLFHPHMHAQRVKKTRTTVIVNQAKKRTIKTTSSTRNKKRSKSSSKNNSLSGITTTMRTMRKEIVGSHPTHIEMGIVENEDEMREEEDGKPQRNVFLHTEASDEPSVATSTNVASNRATSGERRTHYSSFSRRIRGGKENQVPTFDLFSLETNWQSRQIYSTGRKYHNHNRIPISQRMQTFLDANYHNGDYYSTRTDKGKRLTRRWRNKPEMSKTTRQQVTHRNNRDVSTASAATDPKRWQRHEQHSSLSVPTYEDGASNRSAGPVELQEENDECETIATNFDKDNDVFVSNSTRIYPLSAEEVFAQFHHTTRPQSRSSNTGEQEHEPAPSTTMAISKVCLQVKDDYPSPSCSGLLKRLQGSLTSPENVSICLLTGLELLQQHGESSLQELISSQDFHKLQTHVQVLATSLLALDKIGSTTTFPVHHGMLENITSNRQGFIDLLVLQLVDSVYAMLHPKAWSLNISKSSNQVLHMLCPLKNALERTIKTSLVEVACKCIIERLESQQWRRGDNDKLFVSCLNSHIWKDYLDTGRIPPKPKEVRLQALGKVWPRVEVEALWGLLAYLSSTTKTTPNGRSINGCCWQVISKLFSCGVLAVDSTEVELPPCPAQLKACEAELRYFTALLNKGQLDPLPSSDSVLINLIRRSLVLQGDDFHWNPEGSLFQQSRHKSEIKLISRLWKQSHPLYFTKDLTFSVTTCRGISFRDDSSTGLMSIKNGLLPLSNVSKRSLELLCAWISRLPDKKVRRNRFIKALASLRTTLLSNVVPTQNATNNTVDSFEAAFGASSLQKDTDGSKYKAGLFQEAVAWIKIVGVLTSLGNSNNTSATKFCCTTVSQIWDVVSNDCMKLRRTHLAENLKASTFSGNSFALVTSIRIMVSVTLLHMNICPWLIRLDEPTKLIRLSDNNIGYDKDAFEFAVSCIAACLICLCDLNPDYDETESSLTAQIYAMITLLLQQLSLLANLDESTISIHSSISFKHVQETLQSTLCPVLMRCFQCTTGNCTSSHYSAAHLLRLLLCTIRSLGSFLALDCCTSINLLHQRETPSLPVASTNGEHQLPQTPINDEFDDDEIWKSIDDSILASMDFASGGGQEERRIVRCPKVELLECLVNAIQQSKPSARFSIIQEKMNPMTPNSGNSFQMSAHGKHIIAKDVERICDCLVSLQAATTEIQDNLFMNLVQPSMPTYFDDDNDAQFSLQVSYRLCSELTCLSKTSGNCRDFVQAHSETFVFNSLGILLDSRRLEVFPTCYFERIKEKAGDVAGEQALTLLDLFNASSSENQSFGGSLETMARIQFKRRKKADDGWKFCKDLGEILSKGSSDTNLNRSFDELLGIIFLEKDIDLPRKLVSFLDSKSLEQETLELFKLLRTLISILSTECAGDTKKCRSFERLVAFCLSLVITHNLKIVQSLKYQDSARAHQQGDDDLRWAKTQELLGAYSELFITIISWVLRETRQESSEHWTLLQTKIRECILSPVLRRQPVDWTISFRQVLKASQCVMSSTRSQTLAYTNVVGLSGCSQYLGGLLPRVIRRSRQLLIASSSHGSQNLGIQSYLIESIINSNGNEAYEEGMSRILGSAFFSGGDQEKHWTSSLNPLAEGIDEYISFVEEKLIGNDLIRERMTKMQDSILQTFVLPRLNHAKSSFVIKKKLLFFTTCILDGNRRHIDAFISYDKSIFRSLIKGIRSSLIHNFKESILDDSFIAALFTCTSAMGAQTIIESELEQTLICWSRDKARKLADKHIPDLSQDEASAIFIWLYFQWLQSIGNMLIDTSDQGKEKMKSFRRACSSIIQSDISGDPSEMSLALLLKDENDIETTHDLLHHLEEVLFPSRIEHNQNVVNVYAKAAPSNKLSRDVQPAQWTLPSKELRKAAKEFMAEVISLE